MPGLLSLFTVLLVNSAGLMCAAQPAQPVANVRYHFGDDPDGSRVWSSPKFNDHDWPENTASPWPKPQYPSDGTIWV